MTTKEKLNALPENTDGDLFVKRAWTRFIEDEKEQLRHSYISENLFRALAEQVSDAYKAGQQDSHDEAVKIAREVIQQMVLNDLKTHPKTTLKAFAKRFGWLPEED